MVGDYSDLIDSRTYSEYSFDEKFTAWLSIIGNIAENELRDFFNTMTYNIDNATGEQLDFIFRIVGDNRAESVDGQQDFFGYDGVNGAYGYDTYLYFDYDNTSLVPIADHLVRIAIRAKITRNVTLCSADSVILAAEFVLGESVTLIDNGDMTFSINTESGEISEDITTLLGFYELEIRPAGVRFLGYNL